MKNVLKKILCLLLCLTLVAAFVFTLAACERDMTDAEKEALRKELLSDLALDLSRGEMNMNMSNPAGLSTQMNVVWEIVAADEEGEKPTLNADVIYVETETSSPASNATVMLLRGEDIYGTSKTLTISGNDKIAGVKKQMSSIIPDLEHKTMEELLELISSQTDVDLSALTGIELPELGEGESIDVSAFTAVLAQYFTKINVSDSGYSISFDFGKVVDQIWNAVYALANIIDQNNSVSLNTLYQSEQFQGIVDKAPVTAAELEKAINQIIAKMGDESGEATDDESDDEPAEKPELAALPAEKDETLYHYLGRYLAIEIQEGVTVGSLTIGDVLCLLMQTNDAPDLTELMDSVKLQVLPSIKSEIKSLIKLDLNFTKDKKFDGIRIRLMQMIDVNIKPLTSVTLTDVA